MCGIVGIVGGNGVDKAVDALEKLEYRGYDSAGVAVLDGTVNRRRAQGKLKNLRAEIARSPLSGSLVIGHTRWATHGPATEANAHPHQVGRVCLVHNGIIENYKEIASELKAKGWVASSQTDTEVVAALFNDMLGSEDDPTQVLSQILQRLEGMFALAIIVEGFDDKIWFARKGSPLVLGLGENEMYAGSDALALGDLSNRIVYLEEGDWGFIEANSMVVFDKENSLANRQVHTVQMDALRIEKAGHKHFMSKEIFEQPVVLASALSYAKEMNWHVAPDIDFSSIDKIVMSACGTASFACEVARHWFEDAGIEVDIILGSEFRHRRLLGNHERTLGVFVSQSGETADTLAAFHKSAEAGRKSLAVVNVTTSSLARLSDSYVPIHAGPEIGVASTKAFTAQLVALLAISIQARKQRGVEGVDETVESLLHLPALLSASLGIESQCEGLGYELSRFDNALFLARGRMTALAYEAALKLKEISYIHAEGYASGELKHGPIALVEESLPVIVLAPRDETFEKTVSNMQEVISRHGKVVLVSDRAGIEQAGDECWKTIVMPECDPLIAPIVYAIPAQMIAYYTALARGTDVDQPRNLAKSVTVE